MFTKNDDSRAVKSLIESVRHSIETIEDGIKAYVFDARDSAYRSVATELRKLLTDKDAVASFRKSIHRAKKAKSLLELRYGSERKIRIKSFLSPKRSKADLYVNVTPNIYRSRLDILSAAVQDGTRVSVRQWLEEDLAHTKSGQIWKVGTAILYIAGKEGSHIVNPVRDEREEVAVAFFSSIPKPADLEKTDFDQFNPWRQFVIDAGIRLLTAENPSGEQLFSHTIKIPVRSESPQTMRIHKKQSANSM